MKRVSCRICRSNDILSFLDLGFHPHSDQFRVSLDQTEFSYPLRLMACRECGLVQLDCVVPPEDLYQKDYLYESSITRTGDRHWTEFASTVASKIGLARGDGVIDIGSNDGTLLSKFRDLGMTVCGVDPCTEIAQIAVGRGIPTINDFATAKALQLARDHVGPPKLVTGANVFAHIDDLHSLMAAVASMLGDGVFVFESPYFEDFFQGLQYDTVYHQHLSYLSLRPLVPFFEKYGLTVFDVDRTPMHGGSFRVYAGRGRKPTPAVAAMLERETWTDADLLAFAGKVRENRDALFELIYSLWKDGKTIAAVSCPAKGQTLLNYTGIGRFLRFATDKSRLKQGRYTPGTHIKIYDDNELIERQPDYALLLAWNFADEIIRNNQAFKGKWIIPIPMPVIR